MEIVKTISSYLASAPPTLRAFRDCPAYSRCVVGAVGSGKTTAAAVEMVERGLDFESSRWVVVRNTYRELVDTTQKTFFEWFPPGLYGTYHASSMTYLMELPVTIKDAASGKVTKEYRSRIEILFRSAERENDVKKFKSLEVTGYWIDEAMEVIKEVKLMLDNRCRYPANAKRYYSILTTNPPTVRHWIYQDYFADPPNGQVGFQQQPFENEANLPVGYYQRLLEQYKNNQDWIKRYIYGEWGAVQMGEAVYP
ncbi:MAG: hypothetical protein HQK56_17195, partial [Deltaproteobacteria bacterium]|nr:hypothetical protein [Deltaproteobacteria bacterium]